MLKRKNSSSNKTLFLKLYFKNLIFKAHEKLRSLGIQVESSQPRPWKRSK